MTWPWGTYLGEEALRTGIRTKISSWQRMPPNRIPHASKATGVYLNSMLAVTEAQNAGYDEAIMLTPEGTVADGPGETIFVVKRGVIHTPDLSTGILHGITRDTIIQIANDLGYTVLEKTLIRSDLYLADEVFMCGTAAEVTPVRSVDDHEIGVGDITRAVQQAYLDTVRGVSDRWAQWREVVPAATPRAREHRDQPDQSLGALDRRARRGARARGAPFGAALARADRAALRVDARGRRRRAALRRRLVGHGGPPPLHADRRRGRRRRGDHVAVLVRRVGELRDLRGRDARVRRHRSEDAQPRPGRGRGGDHAADEGDRRGRHLRLSRASSTSCVAICERHGLVLVEDACEALGARYKGRPLGSHGHLATWAFYPNKQMTTGEGGAVTTGSAEEYELLVSLRNQGRLETSSWLQHGRLGFNYRLDDISAALGIGQLEKLDRILAARARWRPATASCCRASTSSRRSSTTPTTSARGSSTS